MERYIKILFHVLVLMCFVCPIIIDSFLQYVSVFIFIAVVLMSMSLTAGYKLFISFVCNKIYPLHLVACMK